MILDTILGLLSLAVDLAKQAVATATDPPPTLAEWLQRTSGELAELRLDLAGRQDREDQAELDAAVPR